MNTEFNQANDNDTDKNILELLSKHKDEHIRAAVALNDNSEENTLLYLVGDKSEYVKDNLLMNRNKFNPKDYIIQYCKNTQLKPVEECDADFILSLRLDNDLNKHLSVVENDLDKQIQWIKHYKIREASRLEFYFIIQSDKDNKLGAVRLYDFNKNSFCWGSWMIKRDAPNITSIESALTVYEFAFNILGFNQSHFDVRKGNNKVIEFHKRFGAKIISEDELNYYFIILKSDYEISKKRYNKFLLN